MQAGVPEGPDVGRVLAQVEDWWIGTAILPPMKGACRDRLNAAVRDGA